MQRGGETSVPTRPADITGWVTNRYDSAGQLVLLVEANTGREQAYVEVGPTIPVIRRGERDVTASRTDLAVGVLISAWYSGPIRETFPPMATAEAVVILKQMPAATSDRDRRSTESRLVTHEDPGEA